MTEARRRPFALTMLLLSAVPLQAQSDSALSRVGWLAGCWEGSNGKRTVEERWMPPRGGIMLEMGRTVLDGKLRDYEFVVVTAPEGRLVYEAHPQGQPANTFRSIEVSDTTVVFEDPAHDFPQRVGYRRQGHDSLTGWIEGDQAGARRRIEFPYHRVSCE